jgi:hypothetical protein
LNDSFRLRAGDTGVIVRDDGGRFDERSETGESSVDAFLLRISWSITSHSSSSPNRSLFVLRGPGGSTLARGIYER